MVNRQYLALVSLLSICSLFGASTSEVAQPEKAVTVVKEKEKKEEKKNKFKAAHIVVIDAQQVIKDTGIDKEPLKELTDLQKKYQDEFKEEAAALMKKEQELKTKASVLSAEALKKQQEELEDENNKMQTKLNRANNELRAADMQARGKVGALLEQYAKTLIAESGYDMVFERNGGMVAFASRLDRTSELTRIVKADQAKKAAKEKKEAAEKVEKKETVKPA